MGGRVDIDGDNVVLFVRGRGIAGGGINDDGLLISPFLRMESCGGGSIVDALGVVGSSIASDEFGGVDGASGGVIDAEGGVIKTT